MTCALYRHFDANGQLLYVGISINPLERTQAHERDAGWAEEVAYISLHRFPDKQTARLAEAAAIASERPKHNKSHLVPADAPHFAIAQRLRAIRATTDLDQRSFAQDLGFKVTQYANWETGQRRPSIDAAICLADRFGLTLDWIFLGTNPPHHLARLEASA